MKKGFIFGAGLVLGLGGGAGLATLFWKQKYEQLAEEEIASVRDSFLKENERRKKQAEEQKETAEKAREAIRTYSADKESGQNAMDVLAQEYPKPYVITPMQFADPLKKQGDSTLKYYPGEGVVTRDDDDKPMTMEELDETCGREALVHFGEYEDDSVCIRNEKMNTDFQILQMPMSYTEVIKKNRPPAR